MEPLGWFIFIASNIFVIVLTGYCFYRVLAIPKEHMHAPLDIDTKDTNGGDANGESPVL